jgi:hypothetical protein
VTNYASYYVIVNSGTPLCAFIFLHWLVDCNIVLFIGIVSICAVVTSMSMYGIYTPPSSSYIGTFVSLSSPPFGSTTCSFSCTEVFGIVFFCLGFQVVTLPLVTFAFSVAFLVLFAGLVDCLEGIVSACFLGIGTFF